MEEKGNKNISFKIEPSYVIYYNIDFRISIKNRLIIKNMRSTET